MAAIPHSKHLHQVHFLHFLRTCEVFDLAYFRVNATFCPPKRTNKFTIMARLVDEPISIAATRSHAGSVLERGSDGSALER